MARDPPPWRPICLPVLRIHHHGDGSTMMAPQIDQDVDGCITMAPQVRGSTTMPMVLSIPSPCADEEALTLTGSHRPRGQGLSRHRRCLPHLLAGRWSRKTLPFQGLWSGSLSRRTTSS